ncbi:MAG: glutathione S-transferase N-terminal domain-containing protein [Xanthomonadales bacterium]|nr:glutathione S-transferase N-terminal domain-containing protein [Xanthomonadales bacterium]
MIDLYFFPSPNGLKVAIFLEEAGLDYRVKRVEIGRGDQFDPEFLAISPNNKIPAIVDHDGPGGQDLSLFESGAILVYLADKSGRFLSDDQVQRARTLQWLFWQVGGLGPMAGQAHHFRAFAPERVPYGIKRYTDECNRLYGVLDRALAETGYLAAEYSIADMAAWPWIFPHQRQGQDLADFPNVRRWYHRVGGRPAVRRALELGAEELMDEAGYQVLYGQRAANLPGPSSREKP